MQCKRVHWRLVSVLKLIENCRVSPLFVDACLDALLSETRFRIDKIIVISNLYDVSLFFFDLRQVSTRLRKELSRDESEGSP